ncbi:Phosphoglucosamine mutase [Streptomyces violaceorubidus]
MEREALRSDTVVATVMSNLGFKLAMEREGIQFVQTGVGDRYVLEAMKEHGYALGGEQSGHVIILDHATTGDGTLTGLMLAARVAQTGRTLRDLASVMERLPQVLVNVPDVDKSRVSTSAELAAAVSEAERELGSTGRGAAAILRDRAAGAGDGGGRGHRAGPVRGGAVGRCGEVRARLVFDAGFGVGGLCDAGCGMRRGLSRSSPRP